VGWPGGPLDLRLRYTSTADCVLPVPAHALTLGTQIIVDDPADEVAAAAALATESDDPLVVVGTIEQVEIEGADRTTLAVPGHQDALLGRGDVEPPTPGGEQEGLPGRPGHHRR
jgi:beta-glucosidase